MGTLSNQNNQQKAFKYFSMGLTAREIGKLLDLSPRTIERYMLDGGWKRQEDTRTLKEKAKDLKNNGKTYAQIAELLGISKGTVYNYLKPKPTSN